MMRQITPAELDPANDPVALIGALVGLPKERLSFVRHSLLQLVRHHDPDVRTHAVRRLFMDLKDRSAHGIALELLKTDADPDVRRVAAFGIVATSSASTKADDVAELLNTFVSEQEQLFVRGAAYESLLLLFERRDFPPVKREIDLNTDVDWSWINSLRSGDSKL